MGNLKLCTFFFTLFYVFCFSQEKKVINLCSGSLIKKNENQGYYNLKIDYKNNITYNKKHNLKPQIFAGGITYCKNCKKEYDYFLIKEVSKPLSFKRYNLKDFIKKNKDNSEYFDFQQFYNNYFELSGKYYKLTGRGSIQ